VLAQHLDHLAARGKVLVGRQDLGLPGARSRREDVREAVRRGLVGAEDAEVVPVPLDHVAKEAAQYPGRLAERLARRMNVDGVVAEVREQQVAEQNAAVRARVGAHPPLVARRELEQLRHRCAVVVEELLGPVGAHPLLEQAPVLVVLARLGDRDLV
jgi:hypothetical protein